ncbi:MAG: AsmA-like C-terminal domain-containing protein [Campylobacterales bacterium]|nr:AsmA-like C-terminal domain-containing protein [Campylobacterales bacterium]
MKIGISLDNFYGGLFNAKGLYLKLDKKLTFRAKELTWNYSLSAKKSALEDIDIFFDRINFTLKLFDYFEIKKLHIGDKELTFIITEGKKFYFLSDDYEINANLQKEDRRLHVDIPFAKLKNSDLIVTSQGKYNYFDESADFNGSIKGADINGTFAIDKTGKDISVDIKTDTFHDIKPLADIFPLREKIKAWITTKVLAKNYKLDWFNSKLTYHNGRFDIDLDSMSGAATLKDVDVHFKENLPAAHASDAIVEYNHSNLYIYPKNATYEGENIMSNVVISDIPYKDKARIKVSLGSKDTRLSQNILDILNAYKIKLPLIQNSGKVSADVELNIKFYPKEVYANVDVDILESSEIKLGGVPLIAKNGNVMLRKNILTLSNIALQDEIYDLNLSGTLDTKKRNGDILLNAKHLEINGATKNIINVENKKIKILVDYDNKLLFKLPKYDLEIQKEDDNVTISLGDIKKIAPFMKNHPISHKGGNLKIMTNDFKDYAFKGTLLWDECFLFESDNLCITRVPFEGNVVKGNMRLYAFNKRLIYDSGKSLIWLDKVNVDIEKLLRSKENYTHSAKNLLGTVKISADWSKIRYGRYSLLTDHYDADIDSNQNVKAIGSMEGDVIEFDKKKNIVEFKAYRTKDKLLAELINFHGLKEGRYSFKFSGDIDKEMKGDILIEGGVLSDFTAYSNLLAFINTIPSLASLNSPGFSAKGFKIKDGIIDYTIKDNIINFHSIYVRGKTANIAGRGTINLETKDVEVDLAIQSVKEAGSFLGKIPVLGYILLGKDESMTIGTRITGSYEDPKIETNVAQDVLLLPVVFLERMVTFYKQFETEK